jgi:hypothetical protein
MTDFIVAIVSILYAAVCLVNEADQDKCSTSSSAQDHMNREAKG